MKKLYISIIIATTGVLAAPAAAETEIWDDIYEDQHWTTAGSPYYIHGWIQVYNYATITVDPSVDVIFAYHATEQSSLIFDSGAMNALGTPSGSIDFWAQANERYAGIYHRVTYVDISDPPSYSLNFKYCTFSNMNVGFGFYGGYGNGAMRAHNCEFLQTTVSDAYQASYYRMIGKSEFKDCRFYGTPIDHTYNLIMGSSLVDNCRFEECTTGLYYVTSDAALAEVKYCTFEDCVTGMVADYWLSGQGLYTYNNWFLGSGAGSICYGVYTLSCPYPWTSENDTFKYNEVGVYFTMSQTTPPGYVYITGAKIKDNELGVIVHNRNKVKIRGSEIMFNRRQGLDLWCEHNEVDLGTDYDPGGNSIMYNGDDDPETDECDIRAPGNQPYGGIGLIPAVGNYWQWATEWEIEYYDILDYWDDPSYYCLDVRVMPGDAGVPSGPYAVKALGNTDGAGGSPIAGDASTPTEGKADSGSSSTATDAGKVNIRGTSLGNIKAMYK